uniref:Putative k-similarity type rna binding protein n=1 Tax=Xenopsylla cheopis TaxID=163159 RepID=A0A6M2DRD4_XENCH
MSDYSSVAPPKNFSQSTAFAAALQRAKQIAAKINPASTGGPPPGSGDAGRTKRPLEDGPEPEAKKLASLDYNNSSAGGGGGGLSAAAAQAAAVAARVAQNLGSTGGPMGATCSEDIRVPDKMVGLIIGRGGEQITRLQAECGCKIQMAPDSGGLPDRLCSLSGPRDAVARAREMIMNIVNQRGRTEGLGDSMMGGGNIGGGGNGPPMAQSGPTSVEIMIPGPKVGLIIGKGGETIKQLQEKSGAKMIVIQEGPNPEQEKPLRITGDIQKVEYAKQLVYDLIAEKEMQAFNRGGRMGGNGGPGRPDDMGQEFPNLGGGEWIEVFVPKIAVGVVIGKGGDMIKKIQMDTGCRLQFQQNKHEGPGDRLCYLQGKPQQVQAAKDMIEDLIDSVQRDPSERGRPRNGNRPSNGGPDGFPNWGGGNGSQSNRIEVSFIVPSMKCGVIIGRGGETIKQINAQSGAHCVLDRNAQNNPHEKLFIIRGEHDQVEAAKRIISETVQMPLNFQITSGNPHGNANNMGPMGHTGYPGMGAPQGYPGAAAQGWGYNPQGWGATEQPQHNPAAAAAAAQVQINPATGQPDYSQQWIEYYRSMGMHREASMIEQQSKGKAVDPSAAGQNGTVAAVQPQAAATQPNQQAVAAGAVTQMAGAQPDYSAQWAEYYRSIGNIKEAEAIEANLKQSKAAGQAQTAVTTQQSTASAFPAVGTTATAQTQPGPPGAYGQPTAQAGQPGYPMNPASYMQSASGMTRANPTAAGNPQFQGYPGYGGYPQQGNS